MQHAACGSIVTVKTIDALSTNVFAFLQEKEKIHHIFSEVPNNDNLINDPLPYTEK